MKVKVCGSKGCEEVEAEVDTGADIFIVSREILERIGAIKVGRGKITLADGSEIWSDVYSVKVKYEGRETFSHVAPIEEKATIDRETIEKLNLMIDPVEGRIIKKPYKGHFEA